MKKRPEKSRVFQFNLRLSEGEKKWLDQISQARGISASGFLRMQIRMVHKADLAKENAT